MISKTLSFSLVLLTLTFLTIPLQAEVLNSTGQRQVVVDNNLPTRGMTKSAVSARYGSPISKNSSVGQPNHPPISSWDYGTYRVYFEHSHVIHTVVSK